MGAGHWCHPLKGPCQATKTTPLHDFDLFSCPHVAVSYHHLCQCRSFFRFRQSCFAAPVTHQDQDGHRCSDGAPSAVCGPENLRFQAVSKWWSQVSWLLTSPKVAHGVGSKDADNSIKCWVERLANQAFWFLANPKFWFTVPANS